MKIRQVKASDAEGIVNIYNHFVTDTTISFETTPLTVQQMKLRISEIAETYPYLVATDDHDKVTGYCYAHAWKERAAYSRTLETTIYVSQAAQRKGLGLKLMKSLIDKCRNCGYRSLIACITADNNASIDFHARLGFQKVSHFKNVGHKNGMELDVIDMQLIL